MKVEKYGRRTRIATFDELEEYDTSVFILEGKKKIYIIDTFCGIESMEKVKVLIGDRINKEIIVINTHFHWDHIWGNCVFENNIIVSSLLTKKMIEEKWEEEYKENKKYIQGEAVKKLPNLTFEGKIVFEEDGIEIFQSPGHTIDSITIYDRIDNTLIVGDNLERPLVYVESNDLKGYITTLERYKEYFPCKIFASHTLQLEYNDIERTISYLSKLMNRKEISFETKEEGRVHIYNRKFLFGKVEGEKDGSVTE